MFGGGGGSQACDGGGGGNPPPFDGRAMAMTSTIATTIPTPKMMKISVQGTGAGGAVVGSTGVGPV